MRRSPLVLLLAPLAACALPDEGPRYGEPAEAPAGAVRAAEAARDIWAHSLGLELPEPPTIEWFTGQCLDLGVDRCVIGRTVVAGDVSISGIVAAPARVTAHELLHWALYLQGASVDPQHTHPAWDDIVEVTLAVAEEF